MYTHKKSYLIIDVYKIIYLCISLIYVNILKEDGRNISKIK